MDLFFPVEVKKSRVVGKGAFALKTIPARKKIGQLVGEIISYREARKRARKERHGQLYIVEFDNEPLAFDASAKGNALSFINHSCSPNTYMRRAYRQVEFYALRPIKKGEELTCDYGETQHEGELPCRCGASNCRGFL